MKKINLNAFSMLQNNIENPKDDSPIVLVDPTYLKNEKILLKNIVKEEIANQGENYKKLSTANLNMKRNITILVFGLLTFICAVMYFFNMPLSDCFLFEGIVVLLYILITKRLNIVNVISKQAKNNPNEEISKMVTEIRNNKKTAILPDLAKIGLAIIAVIFISKIVFAEPQILYAKYGDGYAVIKYTKGLKAQEQEIVIPDKYNGKDVIAIGEKAFANTKITNIKLPQNLETIKSKAFYNCSLLTNIVIPEGVTQIRASAFENCLNLEKVSLSNNIVDIRASAFKNNIKLENIKLPDSLEYIGASAFSNCSSLVEITIPNKVTEINGQTFEYCTALKRIYLHDNIISIHGETFKGDKNLDNVILPSKITEIRGNTFEDCKSLSSIIIPEGVTRIGGHAFYGCTSLKNVSVPSTVVEIGSSAFRCCKSLRSIKVPRKAVINERAFKESPTKITYY